MNQEYHIQLEIFEGPLDLLLYLVNKDEVDIKSIQVSRVCRQFVEYLELMKDLNIDVAGEYLVMASTLIRLKAQELLPQEAEPLVGIDGEIINREQLIAQLLEYKKYKEAALSMRKMENNQWGTFYKPVAEKLEWEQEFTEPVQEAQVFDLLAAFKKLLDQRTSQPQHHIQMAEVGIDDCIEHILGLFFDRTEARFEDLFPEGATRMRMVVTFMAMLELIKMSRIQVRQETIYGQIWVALKDPDTAPETPPEEEKSEIDERAIEPQP